MNKNFLDRNFNDSPSLHRLRSRRILPSVSSSGPKNSDTICSTLACSNNNSFRESRVSDCLSSDNDEEGDNHLQEDDDDTEEDDDQEYYVKSEYFNDDPISSEINNQELTVTDQELTIGNCYFIKSVFV